MLNKMSKQKFIPGILRNSCVISGEKLNMFPQVAASDLEKSFCLRKEKNHTAREKIKQEKLNCEDLSPCLIKK